MASSVSRKQARNVVEAAREAEWKLPSFGKGLFLGDCRFDLIHPQPRLDADAVENGGGFVVRLQVFLETEVIRSRLSARRRSPTARQPASPKIGALVTDEM